MIMSFLLQRNKTKILGASFFHISGEDIGRPDDIEIIFISNR